MERPSEETDYHTRLLKCSLEVEHSRLAVDYRQIDP